MRTALVLGAVAALAAAGGGTAYYLNHRAGAEQDRAATAVIDAFAAGWQKQDPSGVPFAQADAAASFTPTVEGLAAGKVVVQPGRVRRSGDLATAELEVTWTLTGDVPWTYQVPARAERSQERWVIAKPTQGSYWNADLNPGDALAAKRTDGSRGGLLGRDGKPLMPLGTVYPVQLDPARATPEVAAQLEKLVKAEPGSLVAKLAAAKASGSKAPIPVITYRESDFAARQGALDALAGVIYPKTVQPLATDREFGQPLLGSFGEVTAEIVKESDGRYTAGDRAGISGLQRTYDSVLSGTPGIKVTTTTGKILFEKEAVDGKDVQLTLDPAVQRAAERALTVTADVPAAFVVIDVPTGDVVAAANRPWFGFDRAITGRFPPGSTFKIASSYALLSAGDVSLTEPVSCPRTFTVDGREFTNYEGETLGSPTFADDVTHSCNTAFVQLSARLGDGDLASAATALGIGAGWAATLDVPDAFDGSVPQNNGKTDKAAATIGQGRDLVSPMALAVMTGSVARGSYVPPALVTSPAPEGQDRTPSPLDEKAVADLRTVLRSVVTEGTATALAGAPGGPVFGKTGTAEFGTATPPKTHAWFTGYQGDIAFAVLVEEGRSGGSVAAPIARSFLTALAGR